MPDWVIHFRSQFAYLNWADSENDSDWVPEFLLRSETALMGLALKHSCNKSVYEWIFVRFVAEALRPFVEHAQQLDGRRRKYYNPLVKLYHLCEHFDRVGSDLSWPKYLAPVPIRICHNFVMTFQALLAWLSRKDQLDEPEAFLALIMSSYLLEDIAVFLNPNAATSRWQRNPIMSNKWVWLVKDWNQVIDIEPLDTLHQLIRDGSSDNGRRYTDLVATAFLTSLETECPQPDWLPRI